jgi:hypothetical protein
MGDLKQGARVRLVVPDHLKNTIAAMVDGKSGTVHAVWTEGDGNRMADVIWDRVPGVAKEFRAEVRVSMLEVISNG